MTRALVLGGGGITGIAWETGLLQGLRDRGVDLTGADLIVGTSAGSVVGAQIATGVDLDRMYERQAAPVQYMDGSVRSTTNSDVAAGHELVVMDAPMGRYSTALDEEVADLQLAGSRVEVIARDEAALEAVGPNPLDPARRPDAARAGLAQAAGAVDVLAAVWELR